MHKSNFIDQVHAKFECHSLNIFPDITVKVQVRAFVKNWIKVTHRNGWGYLLLIDRLLHLIEETLCAFHSLTLIDHVEPLAVMLMI